MATSSQITAEQLENLKSVELIQMLKDNNLYPVNKLGNPVVKVPSKAVMKNLLLENDKQVSSGAAQDLNKSSNDKSMLYLSCMEDQDDNEEFDFDLDDISDNPQNQIGKMSNPLTVPQVNEVQLEEFGDEELSNRINSIKNTGVNFQSPIISAAYSPEAFNTVTPQPSLSRSKRSTGQGTDAINSRPRISLQGQQRRMSSSMILQQNQPNLRMPINNNGFDAAMDNNNNLLLEQNNNWFLQQQRQQQQYEQQQRYQQQLLQKQQEQFRKMQNQQTEFIKQMNNMRVQNQYQQQAPIASQPLNNFMQYPQQNLLGANHNINSNNFGHGNNGFMQSQSGLFDNNNSSAANFSSFNNILGNNAEGKDKLGQMRLEELFESSLFQVSHKQVDRRAFKILHPWSQCCEQISLMEATRSLNQLDDIMIVRCICRYSSQISEESEMIRCRLLNYAISKVSNFSTNNRGAANEINCFSVLKSLVLAIDSSIKNLRPIKATTIDSLSVDYKMQYEANKENRPVASAMGQRSFRGSQVNSKQQQICFAFQRKEGCRETAATCPYRHECKRCKGKHGQFKCSEKVGAML